MTDTPPGSHYAGDPDVIRVTVALRELVRQLQVVADASEKLVAELSADHLRAFRHAALQPRHPSGSE